MLNNKYARYIYALCCVCLLQLPAANAHPDGRLDTPDTLQLDLRQAQRIFLDSNLQLLAQHYNVQSQEALAVQARKWDNPLLNTSQNVYSNNRFFEHGTDAAGNPKGQVYVQVQQLIKTAGKRGRQIDLAQTNALLAEWQFRTVLRDLRALLIRDFYTIAQLQGNASLYNENMQRLDKLLLAQDGALKAGNIARKEYLRVQALKVGLQQDMVANARDMTDVQGELKTLLRMTGNVYLQPIVADTEAAMLPAMGILPLIDSARMYNTDYQQQIYQAQYSMQNIKLQKAMAVPDLTVGPEYDLNSNYTPHYFGLGLALPLPVWDRNQGNIKAAKLQHQQEQALLLQADKKLQNDVLSAWQKLQSLIKLNTGGNELFYKEYYQLQKNITQSYNDRQIGLIEFLEYFKDYQDIKEKQYQQLLALRLAKLELNDITGTNAAQ